MRRALIISLLVVLLVGTGAVFAASETINLSWWTVDGGGSVEKLSGGAYTLQGTIGQMDAGTHRYGSFDLQGGFWNVSVGNTGNSIYLPIVVQ